MDYRHEVILEKRAIEAMMPECLFLQAETSIHGTQNDSQANLVRKLVILHENARRLGFTQCPHSAHTVRALCGHCAGTV